MVTGVPLMGYGAIRAKLSRSYYDTSWFESQWYLSADEARKVHDAAAVKFAELRVEAVEKAERDAAKKAVAEVQARVKELYNDSRLHNSKDSSLRGELYNRAYTGPSSSAKLADLGEWQAQARELIARVEAIYAEIDRRKVDKDRGRERLTQLLKRDYAVCPACGQSGSWTPVQGSTCYCVEYESFDEDNVVFRESVATDGRVLVRAELYRRRRSQQVHLNVLDEYCPELSEVTTRIVWAPPSEEERELKQQIQNAEYRLQDIARELDKCEGEHPMRILLKFGQDASRGTLFAIAVVHELSVFDSKSDESIVLTGSVRFVCDPTRCGWLNVPPPKASESWICSWGKMIGRIKSMPIVIANPQVCDDAEAQKAIEVEIKDIEAKIAALRGGSSVLEIIDVPEPSAEQPAETLLKGEVTTDMLAVLAAKFGK